MKSLCLRSELLVMDGLSGLTDRDDYWVQATPSEPNFWVGNQLILKRLDFAPKEAMRAFEAAFPGATHRAFIWDIPTVDPMSVPAGFAAAGCEVDTDDTLVLTDAIRTAAVPDGIVLRMLDTDLDWRQAHDLQLEVAIADGYDAKKHAPFLARRNGSRRAQIARGLGQWFGAFEGELLVAQMGIFHDDQIARYQSVETRATHRRRGICAALLRHCCLWVQDRAPGAQIVIVAEADSDAGRLYRRMGFAHAETVVSALRPGY